jgi:hypothetical protein
MQKTFFLLIFLITFSSSVTDTFAQVEPPNYNFSLDTLSLFFPGAKLAPIQKKWGKGELAFDKGSSKVYKFYVAHIRYKFPVFVHIYKNESISFYARLPSYFLHNIFHQSLINRLGKQDEYSKVGNAGVYIWNNKENIKYIYQGQCTLTCFPMYLSGVSLKLPNGFSGQASLMDQFSHNKVIN